MTIAVYGRDAVDFRTTEALLEHLSARGVSLAVYEPFLSTFPHSLISSLRQHAVFCDVSQLDEKPSLCISIGGDGTLLAAMSTMAHHGIPVAGINLGRLGFLTAARASEGLDFVDALVSGNYNLVHRSLLEVSSPGLPSGFDPFALNEVSIHRAGPEMLSIDVRAGEMRLPTYWADGLLVATATGSTAYSLSVGGPVVTPDCKVLIIAPIAPHNLNIRPLVIPEDSSVQISASCRSGKFNLTVDNRTAEMHSGCGINVCRAPFTLDTVSLNNTSFIGALREKLLWGEDKRNRI